jgi:DNA topoisomerase VI subunit B
MAKAKSIIEALVIEQQEQEKEVHVKAKVVESMEDKINFICKKYGIKVEDYLGKLLEKSEVNKVYKELKEKDINLKKEDNFEEDRAE